MQPSRRRFRGLLLLILWASGAVLLTGCQTAGKRSLTPEEIKAVEAGQKSVVLVRLTSTEAKDRESLEYLRHVRWNIWNVNDWQNRQFLTRAEDSAADLFWRVPSEESGRAGWRYLVLEPGRYFMEVKPDEGWAKTFPVYHVSIPPGPGPVYVGSFRFTPANSITRLVQGRRKEYPGVEFAGAEDESRMAREAATNLSSSLGSIVTRLAITNDLATVLQSSADQKVLVVEATNRPPHATRYVSHKGAIIAAPLAVAGMALIWLANGDDDDDYGDPNDKSGNTGKLVLLGTGGLLLLAAVPVAALGEVIVGPIVQANWAPHEAALKQAITNFNLAQHLTNSLQQALSGTNPAGLNETNTGTSLVVHVDVYRIGLEPTTYSGWDYDFEIEVYLSVTEAASSAVLWEHGYLYCSREVKKKKVPFATLVVYDRATQSLKVYKDEPGLRLLHEELEDAATRLSDEMATHLKAAGF
jgi:hypothetical protein